MGKVSTLAATAVLGTSLGMSPAFAGNVDIPIVADDIGGVVSGPKGPEAGVWVIAETTGLPTRFAKIVVTDEQGRYVVPDLPSASYEVFVRGYGLVASPRVMAKHMPSLDLSTVVRP